MSADLWRWEARVARAFRAVDARKGFDPNEKRNPQGEWSRSGEGRATNVTARQVQSLTKKDRYAASETAAKLFKHKATPALVAAVEHYVGNTGHFQMNGGLRKGNGKLSALKPKDRAHAAALDAAMSEARGAAAPLTVVRTLPASKIKALKVGDVMRDHGYVSTSFCESVVNEMGANSKGGQARLSITLPKGFKFLSIPSLADALRKVEEDSEASEAAGSEAEALLPRGTALKITRIERPEDRAKPKQQRVRRAFNLSAYCGGNMGRERGSHDDVVYHAEALYSHTQPRAPKGKTRDDAKGYDPNEPRDETGKWTVGGAKKAHEAAIANYQDALAAWKNGGKTQKLFEALNAAETAEAKAHLVLKSAQNAHAAKVTSLEGPAANPNPFKAFLAKKKTLTELLQAHEAAKGALNEANFQLEMTVWEPVSPEEKERLEAASTAAQIAQGHAHVALVLAINAGVNPALTQAGAAYTAALNALGAVKKADVSEQKYTALASDARDAKRDWLQAVKAQVDAEAAATQATNYESTSPHAEADYDDEPPAKAGWQKLDFLTQISELHKMRPYDASRLMPETFPIPPPEPTPVITKAVKDYVSDFAEGFNARLREAAGDEDQWRDRDFQVIEGLDIALHKVKGAPAKMMVMRGLRTKDSLEGLGLGDIYEDHGYMSTSLSQAQADQFCRDAMLKITIPKGFKFIPVPSYFKHPKVDDGKSHDNCQEAECLLPRGVQLKITKIEGGKLAAGLSQWDNPRYDRVIYHCTAIGSSIQPRKTRAKPKPKVKVKRS